jgi:hypothetical protein
MRMRLGLNSRIVCNVQVHNARALPSLHGELFRYKCDFAF